MKRRRALFIFGLSMAVLCAFSYTALAQSIELSFDLFINAQHTRFVHCHAPWIKMIEERTAGKVKITPYFANSLSPFSEKYDSCAAGTSDISEGLAYVTPGKFPMSEMIILPGLDLRTAERAGKAWWHLYKTMPAMQKEFSRVKILFLHTTPALVIGTRDKPIQKLDDLKGVKMQTSGAIQVKAGKALGWTPVALNPAEIYLALEKGVIDGCTTDFEMLMSRKLNEVIKHVTTNLYLGHAQFYVMMNQSVWDRLPKDVQKVFDEVTGDWAVDFYGKVRDHEEEKNIKAAPEKGVNLVELPKEEVVRAKKNLAPVKEEYAAELESKGLPGKKALAELESIAAR